MARPRQYKNRVAEIPLFIISSVQTFKRLYKIKNKMKTATAFIVLVCLLVVEVKGELTLILIMFYDCCVIFSNIHSKADLKLTLGCFRLSAYEGQMHLC